MNFISGVGSSGSICVWHADLMPCNVQQIALCSAQVGAARLIGA
jgi:hypothetical protein